MPDTFPLTEGRRVEGGFAIYPNSLLFKAGDYPDKGFSITPEEMKAAADKFTPVEFNSEHDTHGVHKAVLTGIGKHFGGMGGPRRVWVDPAAPDTLRGEVAVPLWLDNELESKSLSMEINKASKLFTGAGLTYTPRVSEAALMSACVNFAMTRHNTPEGQSVMQDLHDMTARAGAVCDRGNTAKMASQHEASAIQKIHDMTADHGATCNSGDKPKYLFSALSGKGETMFEKMKALFSKAGVPDADIDAHLTDAVAEFGAAPGMTEDEKVLFAAQTAELARLRADAASRDAETFVAGLVASGQVMPYEKPALLAQFAQAATDDAKLAETVKFSALDADLKTVEKDGTRVDALKSALSVRPSSGLLREMLAPGRELTPDDFKASFSKSSDKETEAERRERLLREVDAELEKTDAGRKVIAARKK